MEAVNVSLGSGVFLRRNVHLMYKNATKMLIHVYNRDARSHPTLLAPKPATWPLSLPAKVIVLRPALPSGEPQEANCAAFMRAYTPTT
jgi:hypothetical protein